MVNKSSTAGYWTLHDDMGKPMATSNENFSIAGIGVGGLLVILGVLVAIFGSTLLGIIIALVGLVAFGGFAKGRWY